MERWDLVDVENSNHASPTVILEEAEVKDVRHAQNTRTYAVTSVDGRTKSPSKHFSSVLCAQSI